MSAPRIRTQELRAWLKEAHRSGEIAEAWGWHEDRESVHVYVRRLRPARSRARRRILGSFLLTAPLAALFYLMWDARHFILATIGWIIVLTVSSLIAAMRSLGTCSCIIHGRNCKG